MRLWFDVDKERNTTPSEGWRVVLELWFDVDKERDTTSTMVPLKASRCGFGCRSFYVCIR